jgi:hypothetical protein
MFISTIEGNSGQILRAMGGNRRAPIFRLRGQGISAVAVTNDRNIYFCTDLDGRVIWTDGEFTKLVYQHEGRILGLAYDSRTDALYFSEMTSTDKPLPDGKIFRLDLTGRDAFRPRACFDIRQQDLEHDWRGGLTFYNGDLFVYQSRAPTSIYRWRDSGGFQKVVSVRHNISSLAISKTGYYYVWSDKVIRTRSFSDDETIQEDPGAEWPRWAGLALAPYDRGGRGAIVGRFVAPSDVRSLYQVVLLGPNIYDLSAAKRIRFTRQEPGSFRFAGLSDGKYWLHITTTGKYDHGRQIVPKQTEVTVSRGNEQSAGDFRLR